MYLDNIQTLDAMTLEELETVLDEHTRKPVPPDEYTAFSWSASRHATFARCKRQYYLNYYAPRRVRARGNHPAVGAMWWLKQARSLGMWRGSTVHRVAQEAIVAHQQGAVPDIQGYEEQALQVFNRGVRASRRGVRAAEGWVVLQEHIYPELEAQINWDKMEAGLVAMVDALFASEALQMILSLQPTDILEVDEPFQHMVLDGVKVFAMPDIVVRDGDLFHVIDWKTGDVQTEAIRLQMGIYALYVHLAYGVDETDIAVSVVDLGGGGVSVQPRGGVPSLDEAAEAVRESMAAMYERMDSVKYNTAAIADYPMTDDLSLCGDCNFKRACWRHQLKRKR